MPLPSACVLLTGERGAGKTTVCLRLRALALRAGLRCAGVLTLPVFDAAGDRVGLELLDASSEERRPLATVEARPTHASRIAPSTSEQNLARQSGPRIGPYSMVRETLDWGAALVRRGLRTDGSLVFVDEIGPLELERGEGLAPLLEDLSAPDLPPRVLVVRPALLDRLRGRLAGVAAVVKEVLPQSRDSLPAELLRWLGPGTAISARRDLP